MFILRERGGYRDDVLFRGKVIRWIDSKALNPILSFVSSAYTTQVAFISWNNGYLQSYGQGVDHEALINNQDDVYRQMVTNLKDGFRGISRNDNTQSLFGLITNVNLFSY